MRDVSSLEDFFESEKFNRAVKIIFRRKGVDQEELKYGIEKIKGLSPETFGKVCDSLFSALEDQIVEEKSDMFGKYYLDYQGVRFHLLVGQGSTYWAKKL